MDDGQRSKAAATFGKEFMREARSNPALAKNSAVASQTKANARPIPTYAAGGPAAAQAMKRAVPVAPPRKEVIASHRKEGGAIKKMAAGGAGKERKGQADAPGRGPKLI